MTPADDPGAAPAKIRSAIASVASGVDLWWFGLARTPEEIDEATALLSASERARAERWGTDALRHRWIAGRAALRTLLGDVLGIAPPAVAIRRGLRGRPELVDASAGLDFNVSHTRGVALVAIARDLPEGTRIGVDIEHADRDVGADRLARKFLTPHERQTLADLDADGRRQRFLRYWTCKEAMSKATGDGIAAPFRRLDIELAPSPRLQDGPAPYLPAHWKLHFAALPPEWLATLAVWQRP
ncbi:MAG: 4'-phosphopantetheinyl transferase superfamily protein [Betaproteobacteria bacterium]